MCHSPFLREVKQGSDQVRKELVVGMKKIWNLLERFVRICLALLFRILQRELTPQMADGFVQFVKFCLIGVSNTVCSYVVYLVTLLLFEKAENNFRWDYVIGNLMGFLIAAYHPH